MEHGGHASGVFCTGHPFSPCCFEWRDGGERERDGTKKDICVMGKYVDTMRPRSVRCLDGRPQWSIIVPISIEKEKNKGLSIARSGVPGSANT